MKLPHKVIAFSIIITSVIGGTFVVYKSAPRINSAAFSISETASLRAETEPHTANSVESFTEISETSYPRENATETMAKKIAREIIDKNPEGPSLLDGEHFIETINPEMFVEEILLEATETFDYTKIKPVILESELTINRAADHKTLQTYFTALQTILQTTSSLISPKLQNPSERAFSETIPVFTQTINKLFALSVPEKAVPLHIEQIALMQAQKNVFAALAQSPSDPFGAFIALQAWPLIDEEFKTLSARFMVFMETNNLVL